MYTSEIQHDGRKILYTNYTHLSEDQMIAAIHEAYDLIRESPYKVLTLSDFTHTVVSNDFVETAKILVSKYGHRIEKSAVIGITGLKEVLLLSYNTSAIVPAQPFCTKEQAIRYLTQGKNECMAKYPKFYASTR
ncbi:MAG: hypothetical protein ACFHWX_23175 [Bacteroidota bacterium]